MVKLQPDPIRFDKLYASVKLTSNSPTKLTVLIEYIYGLFEL